MRASEAFEDPCVVAVSIAHHDPGPADQEAGINRVLGRLEEVGHLADAIDKDETTQERELAMQRGEELQREVGELRDRARDIAQHDNVWFRGAPFTQRWL